MQIDAAVLREREHAFQIESLELDDPRVDEVLVRIVATGICHSDLAVRTGDLPLPLPIVLGHEGSGIVEAVGSRVTRVSPGDRVVLTFASCGSCIPCRTGHPVYCVQSAAMNLTGTRPDKSTAYRRGGETWNAATDRHRSLPLPRSRQVIWPYSSIRVHRRRESSTRREPPA